MNIDIDNVSGCEFCRLNPQSHSFKEISTNKVNGINPKNRVFYSKPASAELYNNTNSVVKHFKLALNGVDNWEWIFDCDGMNLGHYTQFNLVRELCRLFAEQAGLKKIYIINAGLLINLTIKCARFFWSSLPEIIIYQS